ncbi:MAG: redoxin domain-containing protein [Bacteroidota bacterium]
MKHSRYASITSWLASLALTLLFVVPAAAQDTADVFGQKVPLTELAVLDGAGASSSLDTYRGTSGLVLIFWEPSCLWVQRYTDRLRAVEAQYREQGVNVIYVQRAGTAPTEAVTPDANRTVLYDDGALASRLGIIRAPQIAIFDANDVFLYRGGIDDSPGDAANINDPYLDRVVNALATKQALEAFETQAFGCILK